MKGTLYISVIQITEKFHFSFLLWWEKTVQLMSSRSLVAIKRRTCELDANESQRLTVLVVVVMQRLAEDDVLRFEFSCLETTWPHRFFSFQVPISFFKVYF